MVSSVLLVASLAAAGAGFGGAEWIREDVGQLNKDVYCSDWSPDGNMLATGGDDNEFKIWTRAAGGWTSSTLSGLAGDPQGVAFNPAGDSIVIGDKGKAWREYVADGSGNWNQVASVNLGDTVRGVAFDLAGAKRIAAVHSTKLKLSTWNQGTSAYDTVELGRHGGDIQWVEWGVNGILTAAYDKKVKLWTEASLGSGQFSELELGAHGNFATIARWSPDGTRVASGGWDKIIKIWSLTDGGSVNVLDLTGSKEYPTGISWLSDVELVSSDTTGRIRFYKEEEAGEWTSEEVAGVGTGKMVDYSPEAKQISMFQSKYVRLWSPPPTSTTTSTTTETATETATSTETATETTTTSTSTMTETEPPPKCHRLSKKTVQDFEYIHGVKVIACPTAATGR